MFAALAPGYILMSVSYEAMFFASLGLTMMVWLNIEQYRYHNSVIKMTKDGHNRHLLLGDLFTAVVFLIYIQIAFYGTGKRYFLKQFSHPANT